MSLGTAPSTYGNAKKVQHLVKIASIGPEIARVLVSEVFFRQFNNRRKVGSYVGLTPSHYQSGPLSRDRGISKAGNHKAHATMPVDAFDRRGDPKEAARHAPRPASKNPR
jgi:transposase